MALGGCLSVRQTFTLDKLHDGCLVDGQMRDILAISVEDAEEELQGLLGASELDAGGFARGMFCLRVLGCPVTNGGKFLVIEDQLGSDARDLWNHYAGMREILTELHENWVDGEDFK